MTTKPKLLRCPGWQYGQNCNRLASIYSFHSGPRLCQVCAHAYLRSLLTLK